MPRMASQKIDPQRMFEARSARGLSQEELARRIGCSLGAVGGWERGTRNPSAESLVLLASALRKPEAFFHASNGEVAA